MNIQERIDNGTLDVSCPMDECNDVEFMGALGNRAWFLCGACGWKFSRLLTKEVA